jgi:UDP-N-acetylmuramate dehydrogenase
MDGAVGEDLKQSLRHRYGERARFGEPLSRHTSFRIGGPADVWIEVSTADEIRELQRVALDAGLPLVVFGIGTNVLVSDRGVRGIVVKLGRAFHQFDWRAEDGCVRVRAGAAAPFKKLVTDAVARSLGGLEFAEGIPGSIGGGLLMNAGAFGGEIANVVDGVVGVDLERGEHRLPRSALRFGYRRFDLPAGLVVTHVDFVLQPDDPNAVRDRVAHAKRRRDAGQPLGWPNAGSIFKNPPGEFAGRLIESVGFKGRRIGDAMVSEQHANFILNVGEAKAADVKRLMEEIADGVWRERAVRLVPEIKLVGDWEAR